MVCEQMKTQHQFSQQSGNATLYSNTEEGRRRREETGETVQLHVASGAGGSTSYHCMFRLLKAMQKHKTSRAERKGSRL